MLTLMPFVLLTQGSLDDTPTQVCYSLLIYQELNGILLWCRLPLVHEPLQVL